MATPIFSLPRHPELAASVTPPTMHAQLFVLPKHITPSPDILRIMAGKMPETIIQSDLEMSYDIILSDIEHMKHAFSLGFVHNGHYFKRRSIRLIAYMAFAHSYLNNNR